MKRTAIALTWAAVFLSACGGTPPFGGTTTDTGGDPGNGVAPIPEVLAGNLESFTYDPRNQTLTVVGTPADDGPLTGVYRRRAALDQAGYQAYTAQDGSLDRHNTAFVREIDGVQAAVIVSGVQFQQVFGGLAYSNEATAYSPPVEPGSETDGGLVSYAGTYVGLLNGPGSNEDLLPTAPGTNPAVLSAQAAETRGDVLITADFSDAQVAGIIYNRIAVDHDNSGPGIFPNAANPLQLEDIALDNTGIAEDGTFQGIATQNDIPVGDYGGIFGGDGATAVAGGIRVDDHIDTFSNEIEWGIFVLAACGQPQADPLCNQPHP
ncbi:thymidylate synthase [Sulfitobacter sp. PR48]|uniref:thymidylate synthase n=1 Tax=Sulfitobacter sp. PR48 TaxID=3028383 RepID=UPI00237C160D|nr:thymidylate synthase [Sulfitobacter sp. PR48]MDD9723473.1 thymidylate synthase [Sulfitobacter sp. PR48]